MGCSGVGCSGVGCSGVVEAHFSVQLSLGQAEQFTDHESSHLLLHSYSNLMKKWNTGVFAPPPGIGVIASGNCWQISSPFLCKTNI